MAEKGNVWTGSRARLLANGAKVGYATNVEITEDYQIEDVEVLDNVEDEEQVVVGYKISVSCGKVKIIGDSVVAAGLMPRKGVNSEEHLKNLLSSGDLTIMLEATKKDGSRKAMFNIEQCKVANHNFQIMPRGIVGENLQLKGIRAKDEAEI